MGLKNFIISFVAIGILVYLVITFAYNFQLDNGATTTILDDPTTQSLSSDISSNLTAFSSDTVEIKEIYTNTTLKEGSDSMIIPSQNKIQTKSWASPFKVFTTAAYYVYTKLLGNRGTEFSYVFYSVISLISLIGIFYFIKFLRQGEE